jgi:hypothetical protein
MGRRPRTVSQHPVRAEKSARVNIVPQGTRSVHHNERAARTRPMCPRAKVIKRADAVWIEPRYEAEVAEPLGMTLQILFGVVGMSMWLTP